MKRNILIALLLSTTLSYAQNTSTADAKKIKEQKLIVALKEYPINATAEDSIMVESANTALQFVIKNYWDFNTISDYMPLTKAKEFIKKNKDYCYLTIEKGFSKSLSHFKKDNMQSSIHNNRDIYTMREKKVSYAEELSIYSPNMVAHNYLPYYKGTITKAAVAFSANQLNKTFHLLYNKEFKSIMGSLSYLKKNAKKVSKKTLLIPEEYISPELSIEDVRSVYPHKVEICDLKKVETAILNKNPEYAVMYYTPIPSLGGLRSRLYITSAEDGDLYGVVDEASFRVETMFSKKPSQYLLNKKSLKSLGKQFK